jgi:hypothetical protein
MILNDELFQAPSLDAVLEWDIEILYFFPRRISRLTPPTSLCCPPAIPGR